MRPRSSNAKVIGLTMSGSVANRLSEIVRRDLDELHRVADFERQLILRRRIAILVVGHAHAVDVGDVGHLQLLERLPCRLVDAPHDGVLDERLERGVVPRPLIVTVGGVEDAALALIAHPRPRRATRAVDALHQHGAIVRVLFGEGHGLVPRRERLHALHGRVRCLHDLGSELAASRGAGAGAETAPIIEV